MMQDDSDFVFVNASGTIYEANRNNAKFVTFADTTGHESADSLLGMLNSLMARLKRKHSTENPGAIQKIQAWLDPADFACDSSDFSKYLNAYMPATGNWLRQSDQFARWHSSGGSILWINGIPWQWQECLRCYLD